jgi:hypothetical protein
MVLGRVSWPTWLGEQPATEAELLALLKPVAMTHRALPLS